MPAFEYEALDGGGRSRRGVLSAESPRSARAELRRLKLTPISLAPARADAGSAEKSKAPAHVKGGELVNITRQLSVLIGAGTPLEEALNAIALQSTELGVRKRLLAVRERVTEGWRFAEALGEDKKSFPDLYRAVVAAGETSGDLAGVLDRLATMLEKNRSMRSKAIGSLIYPAILIVVAGSVTGALMTLVVPKIVEQFRAYDAALPLITQIVISISTFLANFGVYIIAFVIFGSIALWQGLKVKSFKRGFDRSLLRVPVLGNLLRALDGARFARTLSTLFAGGAPLLESLTGAQRTIGNLYVRERLDGAITQVREGASMAAALRRAAVLPPMMVHMIAAGERSGAVPLLLDKAAIQMEEEFDTASNVALSLLAPMIIILMGGVVMAIVLAIMLPMLQLNSIAGGY